MLRQKTNYCPLYRVDLSSSWRRQVSYLWQKLVKRCLIARVYGVQFISYLSIDLKSFGKYLICTTNLIFPNKCDSINSSFNGWPTWFHVFFILISSQLFKRLSNQSWRVSSIARWHAQNHYKDDLCFIHVGKEHRSLTISQHRGSISSRWKIYIWVLRQNLNVKATSLILTIRFI